MLRIRCKKNFEGDNIWIFRQEITELLRGRKKSCIGSDLLLAELDETAGIDSRVEESKRQEPATSTRRWL